jgi:hypothetical protein
MENRVVERLKITSRCFLTTKHLTKQKKKQEEKQKDEVEKE